MNLFCISHNYYHRTLAVEREEPIASNKNSIRRRRHRHIHSTHGSCSARIVFVLNMTAEYNPGNNTPIFRIRVSSFASCRLCHSAAPVDFNRKPWLQSAVAQTTDRNDIPIHIVRYCLFNHSASVWLVRRSNGRRCVRKRDEANECVAHSIVWVRNRLCQQRAKRVYACMRASARVCVCECAREFLSFSTNSKRRI